MNRQSSSLLALPLLCLFTVKAATAAGAFQGRIDMQRTRGGVVQTFAYTVGANAVRIERTGTDRPIPCDIVDRETGGLTLLFPHNRSFLRLGAPAREQPSLPPGFPPLPGPPGAGTDFGERSRGPQGVPTTPVMPALPAMPMMQQRPLELTATDDTQQLHGFSCTRFEVRPRGEVMEIWATKQLLPFHPYVAHEPSRFGPHLLEEQWGELLREKGLFPMLVVLKFENGPERMRFEVTAVTPNKIEDPDGALFQPPADYHELQPFS